VLEKTPYLTSRKLRSKSNSQHQLPINGWKKLSSFYMQEKVAESDNCLGDIRTNALATLLELNSGLEKGKVLS
jgi:hypothetical protein